MLNANYFIDPRQKGFFFSPLFLPPRTDTATITGNSVTGLLSGNSPFINNSNGFTATVNNNSWQLSAQEAPFGGTPAPIPGTLQAENYDLVSQAIGYNVTSINEIGNF